MPLVCILPNVQVYQYPNGVRACTRCSRGYAEARALGMTLADLWFASSHKIDLADASLRQLLWDGRKRGASFMATLRSIAHEQDGAKATAQRPIRHHPARGVSPRARHSAGAAAGGMPMSAEELSVAVTLCGMHSHSGAHRDDRSASPAAALSEFRGGSRSSSPMKHQRTATLKPTPEKGPADRRVSPQQGAQDLANALHPERAVDDGVRCVAWCQHLPLFLHCFTSASDDIGASWRNIFASQCTDGVQVSFRPVGKPGAGLGRKRRHSSASHRPHPSPQGSQCSRQGLHCGWRCPRRQPCALAGPEACRCPAICLLASPWHCSTRIRRTFAAARWQAMPRSRSERRVARHGKQPCLGSCGCAASTSDRRDHRRLGAIFTATAQGCQSSYRPADVTSSWQRSVAHVFSRTSVTSCEGTRPSRPRTTQRVLCVHMLCAVREALGRTRGSSLRSFMTHERCACRISAAPAALAGCCARGGAASNKQMAAAIAPDAMYLLRQNPTISLRSVGRVGPRWSPRRYAACGAVAGACCSLTETM